jgi:hypothetical protein
MKFCSLKGSVAQDFIEFKNVFKKSEISEGDWYLGELIVMNVQKDLLIGFEVFLKGFIIKRI